MSKSNRFEEACKKIRARDIENRRIYKLKGRKREATVTLKSYYRPIAQKYLQNEIGPNRSTLFPWKQVTDACQMSEVYVTDIVKNQYVAKD